MRFPPGRSLLLIASVWFAWSGLWAQPLFQPLSATSKAEPGLELAVDWKWWVAQTQGAEWGMPLPEALKPKKPGDTTVNPVLRPETYEVRKGDALVKIARDFDMSVEQLKEFNGLKSDLIIIGQELRIPTAGDLLKMAPPPAPPKAIRVGASKKKGKVPEVDPEHGFGYMSVEQLELEYVLLQVFLDREMFSPGLIDGRAGPIFRKISGIYQRAHLDAATPAMLLAKARAEVTEPYTRYVLRADDFKFIKPPKEGLGSDESGKPAPVGRKGRKAAKPVPAPPPPPVTIDELVAEDFLGYTSAWEFVAERFHCDEQFLRRVNSRIKGMPVVGTEFKVPNVIPFEIENVFEPPLQPAADPQKPVTAAVVLLSRLEISRGGGLIAVMPLAMARPGLYGRGKWTILDAIPQPHLATRREPRVTPAAGVPGEEPPPGSEQRLACGPNNPVGVIWINLAKSGSTDPLPYGLHGTGIPAEMGTLQGIGGLRLSNWNIARAVRLIPVGTELEWKAK